MNKPLTSRERVLRTIRHQEPDRVPIDFGGTNVSTAMVGPYRRLSEHLGIDVSPIYVAEVVTQVALVDDKIADELRADAKQIYPQPVAWYEGAAYDGTPVLYPDRFRPELQPDGSRILRDADGFDNYRLPAGGYFYDVVRHPLKDVCSVAELDEAKQRIDNFDRPYWNDLPWEDLAERAKTTRETTDKVVIGNFTGHIFQAAQFLRGWTEFMVDLVTDTVLAEALLDRLAEAQMRAFDRYAETVGKYVDIIQVNDDLGMQHATWTGPDTYRKLIKPYHAKLYRHIKDKCDAFLFLHSDGSLYPIIPDLIEIGVDILNPVQYTAADMDLAKLKREFGNDICFWGGGIDTQEALPSWEPEQVADQVRRNIDVLAPGGGFVFATVHNVVEGVPVENVLATFRTAAEHGRY